jgi:hypothetical protein
LAKSLPHIAGHLVEQGPFAVHDFVVRKGQDEIFGEGVNEPECQVVVMELTMDRVLRNID